MADLQYTTAPKEQSPEDAAAEELTFTIDGVEYAARRPKDVHFAALGPITQRRTSPLMKVQLALDFVEVAVIEPHRSRLVGRLMDETDDFDVDDCVKILADMAAAWGRPLNRADRRR